MCNETISITDFLFFIFVITFYVSIGVIMWFTIFMSSFCQFCWCFALLNRCFGWFGFCSSFFFLYLNVNCPPLFYYILEGKIRFVNQAFFCWDKDRCFLLLFHQTIGNKVLIFFIFIMWYLIAIILLNVTQLSFLEFFIAFCVLAWFQIYCSVPAFSAHIYLLLV